jgi:TadE-like protein
MHVGSPQRPGRARAQTLVGLALALPLFLFVLIGTFQLLLGAYTQQVALGAAQGAARLVASRDAGANGAAAVAEARARDLLGVGLGQLADSTDVHVESAGDSVTVTIRVTLSPLVPLTGQLGFGTIEARSRANREFFRLGGGSGA